MAATSPATRLLRAVRLTFGDPWQVIGSAALVVGVIALAMIIAHARALGIHSNNRAHEFTNLAIASPVPTWSPSPIIASPSPSDSPSPGPGPQVAPLTGGRAVPSATPRVSTRPRPTPTPASTTHPPVDSPPRAALTVTVTGLSIKADASGSSDSDSTGLASYLFVFDDGTTAGPGEASVVDHTYGTAFQYTVTVYVTDSAGLVSSASQTVSVGP